MAMATCYRACVAQSLRLRLRLPPRLSSVSPASFPLQLQLFRDYDQCDSVSPVRLFSSDHHKNQAVAPWTNATSSERSQDDQPRLLYEGPFATITLRLKRLSLTSAAIGIVGLPLLSLVWGTESVPGGGQLAIIATAGATAVGSTALLGYCFSPYVHYLERLPAGRRDGESRTTSGRRPLFRITTRDILARRVETTFDPTTDISPPPINNSRPFCNFMVKDAVGNTKPMYVHPEMIDDDELRVQLVGEDPRQESTEKRNSKKSDDDEFL